MDYIVMASWPGAGPEEAGRAKTLRKACRIVRQKQKEYGKGWVFWISHPSLGT
jgi:hypothetical protein